MDSLVPDFLVTALSLEDLEYTRTGETRHLAKGSVGTLFLFYIWRVEFLSYLGVESLAP